MLAPASARASTMALPMPLLPPVTMATLPCKLMASLYHTGSACPDLRSSEPPRARRLELGRQPEERGLVAERAQEVDPDREVVGVPPERYRHRRVAGDVGDHSCVPHGGTGRGVGAHGVVVGRHHLAERERRARQRGREQDIDIGEKGGDPPGVALEYADGE